MLALVYHWPIAFLLTQAIEMPIYHWGFKRFGHRSESAYIHKLYFFVFIASMITHPFIFLYLPIFCHHQQLSQNTYYLLAESIAILGESFYFYVLGFRYQLSIFFSIVANLSSAILGLSLFKDLLLISLVLSISFACQQEDQRICEPATNKGCDQNQHCVINQAAVPICVKTKENALKLGELCQAYDDCVQPLSCVYFFGMNRCLPACSLDVSSVEGTLACQDQSDVESSCLEQVSFQFSQCISFLDDRPDIGFCISPCRPWAKDCEIYGENHSCRISTELPFAVCMPSATQSLNELCGIFGACKDGLACIQQGTISKCASVLAPDQNCGEHLIETEILGALNPMPITLQCEDNRNEMTNDQMPVQENEMILPFSGSATQASTTIDSQRYRVCLGCELIPLPKDQAYLCQKPTPHILSQSSSQTNMPSSIQDLTGNQLEIKKDEGCYAWQALPLDANGENLDALIALIKSDLINKPKSIDILLQNQSQIWLNGISLMNENQELFWYKIQNDFEMIKITNQIDLPKPQIGTCLSLDSSDLKIKALPCTSSALQLCVQASH
jgi:hypothetical protein